MWSDRGSVIRQGRTLDKGGTTGHPLVYLGGLTEERIEGGSGCASAGAVQHSDGNDGGLLGDPAQRSSTKATLKGKYPLV